MYGRVLARTSAPWSTRVAGMPCVTSITRASGAIRAITPWHVPTKSSWSPKSVRKQMTTRPSLRRGERRSTAATRPSRSLVLGLGDDSHAGRRARPASSPARSTRPAPPRRDARTRGRPTADASVTRSHVRPGGRLELDGPVEGDDVGAERVREKAPRAFGPREQHPPRGRRHGREEPFLRRRGRRPGRRRRTRRPSPRPIAATRRGRRASGAAARGRRRRS